jgi:hypothetical protein
MIDTEELFKIVTTGILNYGGGFTCNIRMNRKSAEDYIESSKSGYLYSEAENPVRYEILDNYFDIGIVIYESSKTQISNRDELLSNLESENIEIFDVKFEALEATRKYLKFIV